MAAPVAEVILSLSEVRSCFTAPSHNVDTGFSTAMVGISTGASSPFINARGFNFHETVARLKDVERQLLAGQDHHKQKRLLPDLVVLIRNKPTAALTCYNAAKPVDKIVK
jgi:hypothetical protein